MDWKATTSTGRVYEYSEGILRTSHDGHVETFKLWMKPMSAPALPGLRVPWAYPGWQDWPNYKGPWRFVDVPVVGERLHVSGRDQWRVSTPVVSVEVSREYRGRKD